MQAWIGHLHQLADRARAGRTATAEDIVSGARGLCAGSGATRRTRLKRLAVRVL